MYPEHILNIPAWGGQYVPYFYQSGLFQSYAGQSAQPISGRESSPDRHFDSHQTVDQIIAHGYLAVPSGDPTIALISDRRDTSWLGLDDLIGQVRRRHEIYESNLYQIELAKCAAMNAIYIHEAEQGPASSEQMGARHKAIQNLYEQAREERGNLWRDVSRLRQALPESAQSYHSAHRKMTILQDDGADGP